MKRASTINHSPDNSPLGRQVFQDTAIATVGFLALVVLLFL